MQKLPRLSQPPFRVSANPQPSSVISVCISQRYTIHNHEWKQSHIIIIMLYLSAIHPPFRQHHVSLHHILPPLTKKAYRMRATDEKEKQIIEC